MLTTVMLYVVLSISCAVQVTLSLTCIVCVSIVFLVVIDNDQNTKCTLLQCMSLVPRLPFFLVKLEEKIT